ncbi:MAG TPA: M48 family metallopeptidase [Candidatus Saccharimonadia bacterium]|nr:M48 family metallopeptidase [Candidatus Saccharimonadia bacterium]
MLNIYENVDRNKRNSVVIVTLFMLFVTGVAYVFARAFGYDGFGFVAMALIVSGAMSFASYYFSDKMILGISGARPADRRRDFMFYTVTENLAIAAQIPMPQLYVIDDSAMNAFSTGRDPQHAVVVATTGILSRLNRTELEGVIAHELSHVRDYDIRLMSIVAVLVGLVALLGDWFLRASFYGGRRRNRDDGQLQLVFMIAGFVLALLSPIIAQLIQLAISRRREFLADAAGAELTRYPEGLASALEKLAKDQEPLEAANKATAHMYIVNPLKNAQGAVTWFAHLFDTHPPIADRIKALRGQE